jgi:CBS domain-containing protein
MRKNEPISHIMTREPKTVHPGQPLTEVRDAMAEGNFHHMPVVDGSKLIGMISSTDLLRVSYDWGAEAGNDAVLDNTRAITDVMQASPMTVGSKATVREVAEVFAANWFHALPVVDEGHLVGIVTTTDVMKYLLEQY